MSHLFRAEQAGGHLFAFSSTLLVRTIRQERALARARSKEWHARVTVAAKKIADAEARGLRPPMSGLHRRSAERLRELCSVNGGVYVRMLFS